MLSLVALKARISYLETSWLYVSCYVVHACGAYIGGGGGCGYHGDGLLCVPVMVHVTQYFEVFPARLRVSHSVIRETRLV